MSMQISRQEYWSGLLFHSPGDVPHPGIKPAAPELQVDSLPLSHQPAYRQINSSIIVTVNLFCWWTCKSEIYNPES